MKIVVDGMGGDNAPKSNVEGVVNAIKECNGWQVLLTHHAELCLTLAIRCLYFVQLQYR